MSKNSVPKHYPVESFLRERQILGDPLACPHVPAIIPISRSTWWRGIRSGRFPAPFKLGPRITVWRAKDIYDLIELHYEEDHG